MKKILVGCFTLCILCGVSVVAADSAQPAASGDGLAQWPQETVDELLAMDKPARNARLKQMSPQERRGLWWQVKAAERRQKGIQPKQKGSGMQGRPISGLSATAAAGERPRGGTVGTIQYDSGTPSTSFGGGAIVGNRFDTHTGAPVFQSGVVNTVQGVVVPGPAVTNTSAGFVLLNAQNTAGGANAVLTSFISGVTGTAATVDFTGLGANYTGDSFLVLFGDFASSYVPAFGTGTANGQGFHGLVGYTGGMPDPTFPDIVSTFEFGTLNAFVRAGGNVLPVELMSFDIE